ncbi:hypothetical protein CL617_00780 [archaeon]|jgi:hypothetical protein|nr:hypothetical protein [archaeon]|tara:strand:- start:8260 stop:8622 length:363 start_codon:yes stop_codon:yes gene_type:complete
MEFQIDPAEKLRILESRYSLMRDRMLVINQNMIDQYKKINMEMKLVNDDVKDMKNDLNELKEMNKHIISELQTFARKENFKVLEKYINLWNPLNFVTEDEVVKLIEERGVKNSRTKRKKK